jgi:hypothetical protein
VQLSAAFCRHHAGDVVKGYRVIVHGVLAPVLANDAPRPRGFYTARSVHASSRQDAALKVLALVQADPRVDAIMREWGADRPDITVDEIVDLDSGDPLDEEPQGFIFYDESDREASEEERPSQ